jgi:hypothetical protein
MNNSAFLFLLQKDLGNWMPGVFCTYPMIWTVTLAARSELLAVELEPAQV